MTSRLTALELCAGAGGQALGLERAEFDHVALVDNDHYACETLKLNRPHWNVVEASIFPPFSAIEYEGVDLVAAGIPCPPFSKAGKQLGRDDERDLFPQLMRLVREAKPRAVMIENVRGLLDSVFADYRAAIHSELLELGFQSEWRLLHASDFGVPQLRPRAVCVALRTPLWTRFAWPEPTGVKPGTVGQLLKAEMASGGWEGAEEWSGLANRIAPTLVGGSKKHGGPDLGPTRAKKMWAEMHVDALKLADAPPTPGFAGKPGLTYQMAALVQGFPPEWKFVGRKTAAYRQVGNAFPAPVAEAVARQIAAALETPAESTVDPAVADAALQTASAE